MKKHVLILLLGIICSFAQAQSDTIQYCLDWSGGDRYDFVVDNFSDVVSMQLSFRWDSTFGSFKSFESFELDEYGAVESFSPEEGILSVVWFSSFFEPVSLEDGARLFSIDLETDNPGLSLPYVADSPLSPEILNSQDQTIPVGISADCNAFFNTLITGRVTYDEDEDCQQDQGEMPLKYGLVQFQNGEDSFSVNTNEDGFYWIWLDAGEYTISFSDFNDLYQPCGGDTSISISDGEETVIKDFSVSLKEEFLLLETAVSSAGFLGGEENQMRIHYRNQSPIAEPSVSLDFYYPAGFEIVSATEAFDIIEPGRIRFERGSIEAFEEGFIDIVYDDNGLVETGQSFSFQSEIFPQELPEGQSPEWSGASLSLDAQCDGDNLTFTVANETASDMSETVTAVLIRNDELYEKYQIRLDANDEREFVLPAESATYRMIVNQVPFHPYEIYLSQAVEACDREDGVETGFVNDFADETGVPYQFMLSEELVSSLPSEGLRAMPEGYGAENFIQPKRDIDYQINFQNNSSDTVTRVIIVDTLDEHLAPSSINNIRSSHDVEMEIREDNVIRFVFESIVLPPASVNDIMSRGYLAFEVYLKEDAPKGSIIRNQSDIYFNYLAPVLTGEAFHTISDDFLSALGTSDLSAKEIDLRVFPNPVSTDQLFLSGNLEGEIEIEWLDRSGVTLGWLSTISGRVDLSALDLRPGLYFMKVWEDGTSVSLAKVIVQ